MNINDDLIEKNKKMEETISLYEKQKDKESNINTFIRGINFDYLTTEDIEVNKPKKNQEKSKKNMNVNFKKPMMGCYGNNISIDKKRKKVLFEISEQMHLKALSKV